MTPEIEPPEGPLSDDYKDEEDRALERSPSFWEMIQQRRSEQTCVSLEDLMAELFPADET